MTGDAPSRRGVHAPGYHPPRCLSPRTRPVLLMPPRPCLHTTAVTIARAAASLCDRHRRGVRCVSTEANVLRLAIATVLNAEEIQTHRPDQDRLLLSLDELRCTLAHLAD